MYDVIVVGAGPGGSTAARTCAKNGLKTLLIDEAEFPRYKLCGGGVTEAAIRALGFRLPEGVIEREAYGARFVLGKKELTKMTNRRLVSLVMREKFDHALLRKAEEAGAEFIGGKRAAKILRHGDSMELSAGGSSFRSRALIGADGVNSIVSRLVRPPFRKDELALCLGAEIPAGEKEIDDGYHNLLEMEFGTLSFGYGWVFPKRKHLSVGYSTYMHSAGKLREIFLAYLKRHGFKGNYAITGHMLPLGGIRRKVFTDRVLLVGDAAGFADPFQGEGMKYAILSGQIAGQVLTRALEAGDLSEQFLANYGHLCYEKFGRNLKWARRLTKLVYSRMPFFFRLWEKSPELLEKFACTATGELSYKEFTLWIARNFPMLVLRGLL